VRKFGDIAEEYIPGPPALEDSDRVGFNDLVLDPDRTVRRGLLFQNSDDSVVDFAFALRLALLSLEMNPAPDPEHPEWLRLGPTTLRPLESSDGGYNGLDAAGYQFLLDFGAGRGGFDSIEFGAVLRGEVDPDRLRDRIVLIGVNAESVRDWFPIPLGDRYADNQSVSGVELHGYIVDQLVRFGRGESTPTRVISDRSEVLLVVLFACLGCVLGAAGRGGAAAGAVETLGVLIGGLALLGFGGALFYRAGVWVPVAAPGLAWLSAIGAVTAWHSSRERAQRELLMNLFSRYLSPQIADDIWRQRAEFFHNGRPRPQRLTATILFIDIKGYSGCAEKMDPDALLAWINEFMGCMADLVGETGGVVEDYFGDGMMALFGVPFPRKSKAEIDGDARAAVGCAQKMRTALDELNQAYLNRGFPQVHMRIGINTGNVVAGNVGSANRLKYTVVGDAVVTSKRLEGFDGVEHDFERAACRILVSEATERRLDSSFRREALGLHLLKGKNEKVEVFWVTS
jgi:adenylate cyclase